MSKPNPEVLYYRVRGGDTDGRGVANEARALRGVTTLRDRGFRTFRNTRESLPNLHDARLRDLSSFVNAVFPHDRDIHWSTQIIGSFNGKAIPIVSAHAIDSRPSWDSSPSWDLTLSHEGGIEPVYSNKYIRGVKVDNTITDECLDSMDEFLEWRKA